MFLLINKTQTLDLSPEAIEQEKLGKKGDFLKNGLVFHYIFIYLSFAKLF